MSRVPLPQRLQLESDLESLLPSGLDDSCFLVQALWGLNLSLYLRPASCENYARATKGSLENETCLTEALAREGAKLWRKKFHGCKKDARQAQAGLGHVAVPRSNAALSGQVLTKPIVRY